MEDIVTGEAVVLDLPCARFPTRTLARLIDMLVQIPALVLVAILVGIAAADGHLNDASAAAVFLTGYVLVLVGYPVVFETLSRGRTLGKLALGLRVVGDDGGPERFRQALVRALAGAVECWALLGVPALITSLISSRGKRLGDVFAGTFVVRERAPRAVAPPPFGAPPFGAPPFGAPPFGAPVGAPSTAPFAAAQGPGTLAVEPALAGWAATLDLSGLPAPLAESAASYLSRYWQLHQPARDQLGWQLASDISARVAPPPPPGVPPAAYLAAVLTERRNREIARLNRPSGPPTSGAFGPSAGPADAPSRPVAPPTQVPAEANPPEREPASGGFIPPE